MSIKPKKFIAAKAVEPPTTTPVTLLSLLVTAGVFPVGTTQYRVKGFTLMHKAQNPATAEIKVGPDSIDDTAATAGIGNGLMIGEEIFGESGNEYDLKDIWVVSTAAGRTLCVWLID